MRRKYPPHHYTKTILSCCSKAGLIHAFMWFTPNFDHTIPMSQQKFWLIRPPIFYYLILVTPFKVKRRCPVPSWQEWQPACSSVAVVYLLQDLICCVFRVVLMNTLIAFLSAWIRPFYSDLWHQQCVFAQRTAACWIFFSFLAHSL